MATAQAKPPKRLSCVSCRQRKIKCDRVEPCAPCLRAGIHCVFPQPAPPRAKTKFKAKSDQIAQRLSRLEGLVNALGGEDAIAARAEIENLNSLQAGEISTLPASRIPDQLPLPSIESTSPGPANDIVKPEGGKYLGNDFWTNLSTEVEGLRSVLNDASLEEEEEEEEDEYETYSSPPMKEEAEPSPFAFPFGRSEAITDLASRYPYPPQIQKMFELYFQRFDVVFKVLHRPSTHAKFGPLINESSRFPPGSSDEALAFAIFYGAITTLTPEECLSTFQEEKETALQLYERSLEIALSNARLLTTTDLVTFQAFCIYLMCRRTHYNDRSTWSLISLAVRIATAMDLNSDGETLDLTDFETEMRRRVWWALVVLDIQGSEDRGTTQLIYSFTHDVKVPANFNDDDIDPVRGFLREEPSGFTVMTFSLLIFEVSKAYEYVSSAEPKNAQGSRTFRIPTLEEKERKVNEVNNRLHERYVQHCNPENLLEQKAAILAQAAILKQWLLLQYPISRRGKAIMPRSLATKDQILSSAVSQLEIQHKLETMDKLSWVSRVWIQWHPLAVVLAELCVRTSGPLVERAWAIVDTVFDDWAEKVADTKSGALWRPIRKLMDHARRIHNHKPPPRQSLSRASSNVPTPPQVGPFNQGSMHKIGPTANSFMDPSFSDLHASSIAMALDPSLVPPTQQQYHYQKQSQAPIMHNVMAGPGASELQFSGSHDINMVSINWEDWDTFFQANAYATQPEGFGSA